MALRIRLDDYYDIVPGKGPGMRELIEAIFFPKPVQLAGYDISVKVGHSTLKVIVDIESCARDGAWFEGQIRLIKYGGERLWDPVPNNSDRGTHLDFRVGAYDPESRRGSLQFRNLSVRPGYSKPDLFVQ